MDYEELLMSAQEHTRVMGNAIKSQQKSFKAIASYLENGDLKSLDKELSVLETQCEACQSALQGARELSQSFDARGYVESGDFARQLVEACQDRGVDVKGDFPSYEMFPYKIRMDVENLDLYIDRKKVQSLRPISFVEMVKLAQDKLLKASFNLGVFANELAQAYDLTLLRLNAGKQYARDADCYLSQIYKSLTPMRRFKKDYDQQSFAFDLARLYSADIDAVDDGRRLQFGTSRNIKQAIRILDGDGQEQFLSMIRFYR